MLNRVYLSVAAFAAMAVCGTGVMRADCQKDLTLVPTAAGVAIGAKGTAEVRQQSSQQRFKVSMDTETADRSVFVVHADSLAVGVIRVRLGEGELDLNTGDGDHLPPGIRPVCSVSMVSVTDAKGTVVLNGSF